MSRLPSRLTTPRLVLRTPVTADAGAVNAAITESFPELNTWMEWAATPPTLEDSRTFCRDAGQQWADDTAGPMLMLEAGTGALIGATGYARVNWGVPSFEIGYWCRTTSCGRGFVTEATAALAHHAFAMLGANRVELRMDDRNQRSVAVAERLGFELEGVLRQDVRDHHGALRNTRVYALCAASALTVANQESGR